MVMTLSIRQTPPSAKLPTPEQAKGDRCQQVTTKVTLQLVKLHLSIPTPLHPPKKQLLDSTALYITIQRPLISHFP